MSDSERPKPLPARPAPPPPTAQGSAEPPPAEAGPSEERSTPPPNPPEQVHVPWHGRTWVARVLGRSGRAEARSAPLMLVGFWDPEANTDAHTLESWVPGRRLADVPEEALLDALTRAKTPPVTGQRRPFFDDTESPRRPASGGEY